MDILKEKKLYRKKMKEIRNSIDTNDKKMKSHIVYEKLIQNETFKRASTIMSFMSFSSEIDTSEINNYIIKSGKILLLPKIIDKNIIEAVIYNGDFLINSFGIKEPLGEIFNESIDLILVPGLAFDKLKNRLGYGGGYYDRFLEKNKNSYTIAICFKEQITDSVPIDENDKKVNYIISD